MPPKRWRTRDMIRLLTDYRWDVKTQERGGDVDTTALVLCAKGQQWREDIVQVCGFTTDSKYFEEADDCGIDHVEVTDGQDSCGGLSSRNPATIFMYHEVVSRLERAGFSVVRCLNDFY